MRQSMGQNDLALRGFVKQNATVSSAASSPYKVEIITAFDDIASEWRQLEERIDRPSAFQSFAWCQAWLEATHLAGCPQEVRIVTVRAKGRLVLLWPLALRRTGRCRFLHALAEPATQYCDALIDPTEAREPVLEASWHAITALRDVDLLEMRRVRDDAEIMALPCLRAKGTLIHNRTTAPYLECSPSSPAASQIKSRRSKTRNSLKRHQRKLADHGPVVFEVVTDPAEKIRTLAAGFQFKQQWLASRGLWSTGYSHAAAERFADVGAMREQFLVARLMVGSNIVAVESGFVAKKRYWSMMQSYDPQLASHSPGRLLLWHLIESCSALHIDEIDFLAPAAPHKTEWASGAVPVADYLVPITFRGLLMSRTLVAGRGPLKRLYTMLPAGVRRYANSLIGMLQRQPSPPSTLARRANATSRRIA